MGRRVLLLSLILVLLAAGVGLGLLYSRTAEPFKGYAVEEQFVEIAAGSTPAAIGRLLVEAGVVRDNLTFRAALWRTGLSRTLKAGEYRFDGPMTAVAVIEKISRGEVYVRRLTFPEGLTIREMAALFEAEGFGSARSFVEAASDATLVAALDPAASDLEGYLFPETYSLPRQTSASRLVRLMVERFRAVFTPQLRQEAEARGLTVRQVVTLASLVEKETARPMERPLVAAVYLNRLKIGMGLQYDPRDLRAPARRPVQGTSRGRPRLRLALQHLPSRGACRRGRSQRRALRLKRRSGPRGGLRVFREQERRHPPSPGPSPSTTQTSSSSDSVFREQASSRPGQ